ncbi:hypothetical protein FACS1894171_0830 [Clostridia bacterium]|nr:hypothetical protein FACS1894171_0830 [Clostridia bacterium]
MKVIATLTALCILLACSACDAQINQQSTADAPPTSPAIITSADSEVYTPSPNTLFDAPNAADVVFPYPLATKRAPNTYLFVNGESIDLSSTPVIENDEVVISQQDAKRIFGDKVKLESGQISLNKLADKLDMTTKIYRHQDIYIAVYDSVELYRAYKDEKYGFINSKGDWVIEPQYFLAGDFSDGLASVSIGDYSSWDELYINKKNEVVLKFDCAWSTSFSECLMQQARKDPATGFSHVDYYDMTGNNRSNLDVEYAFGEYFPSAFKNGHVFVPDLGIYINSDGKALFPKFFVYGNYFSEGAAITGDDYGNRYFINDDGEELAKFNVKDIEFLENGEGLNFSDGLVCAKILDRSLAPYKLLDKHGENYFNETFVFATGFQDGLAYVVRENGEKGLMNKSGVIVKKLDYDILRWDNGAHLMEAEKNGRGVVVNRDLKEVEFDTSKYFLNLTGEYREEAGKDEIRILLPTDGELTAFAIDAPRYPYGYMAQDGTVVFEPVIPYGYEGGF